MFQAASLSVAPDALLINSVIGQGVSIGSGSVVVHCSLEKPLKIGRSSVISGLNDGDVQVRQIFRLSTFIFHLSTYSSHFYILIQKMQLF